ncbi:hypothetical protein HPB47_014371 [Ixodes persulcatus]|uniref:Uncharacterized protein n=1 Tax=Ixodes persulcatus TaxID=34615 RepID=A0AC60QW63_IXOPE|nr:hypothetical protein HPB47_014371 [Ixodes persulcatus]
MNLPGLSDFERRILEKECGAGRRAVRGHTTQAPQSASTAAEGSSPATPPTPPPEPPRRVGGNLKLPFNASLLHPDRVGDDGGGGHVGDVAFLERPEAVAWVLESFQRDPAFRDAVLTGVLADPDRPDGGAAIPASCPGAPADLSGAAAAAAAPPAALSPAPADEPGPVVGPLNPGATSFTFDVAMLL